MLYLMWFSGAVGFIFGRYGDKLLFNEDEVSTIERNDTNE